MNKDRVVAIVDDDLSFRKALGRLLRSVGHQVLLYASADAFIHATDRPSRGCLLLDIRMPGLDGLELQDFLNREGCHWPVIFLSGHGDVPMSVRAMKAGAVDFLLKPCERDQLLDAVDRALRTEEANWRHAQRYHCRKAQFDCLTPSQRLIFERVIAGQPNKQIAAETAKAERTVKAHRAEVMRKFEVQSLAELVQAAEVLRQAEVLESGDIAL